MSLNGSGLYQVNSAGQPVVANTLITAAAFNAFTADIAAALSTAVFKDGQQTITANIPMGGYRFTGLGAGASAGQSLRYEQLFTTSAVTLLGALDQVKGADIASASTVNLTTATGNGVHITGTTTITAVTLGSGMWRLVVFDDALTLTHHTTNNNLPGAANITTAAGDRALYWADGTTVYCVAYQKASGLPVSTVGLAASGSNSDITALTALTSAPALASLPAVTSGSVFRKNAIINGDFQIWQEGTSLSSIGTGQYGPDMWKYNKTGAMVHDFSQSSDVPTIAEAGRKIPFSLLLDCTTADAAIAASDFCHLQVFIEGSNFVYIAGVGLCCQFWHKHTKTGTYCVAFVNSGADRSFVREYTQAVSDTWEFASVLVDASPTAGTWDYTTGIGIRAYFTLAAGTDFQGAAGSWNSAFNIATANQVNACDSTANNFRLAGVQLEKGSVATEFDVRTFQDELAACQRYFEKSFPYATAPASAAGAAGAYVFAARVAGAASNVADSQQFRVEKRTSPTVTLYNPAATGAQIRNYTDTTDFTSSSANNIGTRYFGLSGTGNAGAAAGEILGVHWAANARF